MNLQEIVAKLPVRGLRAKLLQQEKRIKQLEEENQWLKEQLAKAIERVDKKQKPFYKRK